MRRAAITGIAGQDGTYLCRLLLSKGYKVFGLLQFPFDREAPVLRRRYSEAELSSVGWFNGSLEDPFSLFRFLREAAPDEIYHLAGLTDSRQSFAVPEESVLAITLGTLRLLEGAREVCPKARIFLASSAEVFGKPAKSPQDENTQRCPVTPYGICKVAADQFGALHRETYGQFICSGILYNHESPLRPPNYLSSRVAKAVADIKRGSSKFLRLGDLSPQRDWSDARDFVRGYWLALQGQTAQDYVFASGAVHTVKDLVAVAFESAGLDWTKFVESRTADVRDPQVREGLCGSSVRAQETLGWKRDWSFEASIRDMVMAELENRPEYDRANPFPPNKNPA